MESIWRKTIHEAKRRTRMVCVIAAAVILVLQLVMPSWLDGLVSIVLFGLGWVAAKAAPDPLMTSDLV